ncbi:MAG: TIGR02757 family protein [Bacteroidales bacterium]|nr:TIGR02757 family protein [Bacteroidales bacterium]
MTFRELKDMLDERVARYQTRDFIEADPISIPHRFSRKEDIEIAGILAATISWGNRKAIVEKAGQMLDLLCNQPYDFVMNASARDLEMLSHFVYRTFQQDDLPGFVRALRAIYKNGGLERIFTPRQGEGVKDCISMFRAQMLPHLSQRTHKHIADVDRGAAAKRINMFLRWMVRPAEGGVDFGLWKGLSPAQLYLPLDVHSGRQGRLLGILTRKQNDWKAVEEITAFLRKLNPYDPVSYDFALFGLGIFEGMK